MNKQKVRVLVEFNMWQVLDLGEPLALRVRRVPVSCEGGFPPAVLPCDARGICGIFFF